MRKLTPDLLERYIDGDLKPKKARQVERLLSESPDHQEAYSELTQIGDLLRLMNEENLANVTFEGFKSQVEHQILSEDKLPPLVSRIGVWLTEFLDHRRVVWIPTVATITALTLALVLLPFFSIHTASETPNNGIQLYSSPSPLISRIDSVDFGDLTGTHYTIKDNQGGTVGVVWINESP